MTSFGWTHLSRDAIRRAEAQLSEGTAGVRDEIGFLIVHQRYADRFFPGTSVLHTRLRYALFVPWIYEGLRTSGSVRSAARAVQQAEIRLTGRLMNAGGGVIGRQNHPKPTNQPPSVVYWTALGVWGLLRPQPNTRLPSRSQIHALLERSGRITTDDDGVPLSVPDLPFVGTPDPPKNWSTDEPLDFALSPEEAQFLRGRLTAIASPVDPSRPSLLAHLAEACGTDAPHCWAPTIVQAAAQEREALARAGHAAALSAIGRGAYAALVETLREEDARPTTRRHRDYLPELLRLYAPAARRLDMTSLAADLGAIPKPVADALAATLDWVKRNRPVRDLRDVYAVAERWRKDLRARSTADLAGRERRLEWNNEEHPLAEPLHFRWWRVRRLLADLRGEP